MTNDNRIDLWSFVTLLILAVMGVTFGFVVLLFSLGLTYSALKLGTYVTTKLAKEVIDEQFPDD